MQPSTQFALSAVLACSLAGCVVGDAEPTLGSSLHAITSTKWATCWARPDDVAFAIECAIAPNVEPLQLRNAKFSYNDNAGPLIDKPGTVLVARVASTSFPVTVAISLSYDATDEVLRSSFFGGNSIVATLILPSPTAYTAAKPLVLEQVADLWPIEVDVQSDVFRPTIAAYDVVLPAGVTRNDTEQTTKLVIDNLRTRAAAQGTTMKFHLLAPRGERARISGLAYFVRGNERIKFELDGPGRYIATSTGLVRAPESSGTSTMTRALGSCPPSWEGDGLCDMCLGNDPDCSANGTPGCHADWRADLICDPCLGDDPDCATGAECPASWRGDSICDECLGDDPDCAPTEECQSYWANDGVCDPCLGPADGDDCTAGILCPSAWRGDGTCDECLGDDPDCEVDACPASWRGDGICDACLGDDPDCAGPSCPAEWRGDGICDECLGDDPDCAPACPLEWYGDGLCDECLGNDPDCEDGEACPWSWYNDGLCDECLGDDPDCE